MQLSLSELAALVGGQFDNVPEGTPSIRGFAAISDAEEGDVTFFANPRYLPALRKSRATAVLVPLDFVNVFEDVGDTLV